MCAVEFQEGEQDIFVVMLRNITHNMKSRQHETNRVNVIHVFWLFSNVCTVFRGECLHLFQMVI